MKATACATCEKPEELCMCAEIQPKPNRVFVLILQHPQEPDKVLGTAKLATQALENSKLKIGLSTPNLKKALGRDDIDPTRWGVLYLGSGVKVDGVKEKPPAGLTVVTKNSEALPSYESKRILKDLQGIVVLDGTWSQAKALWWRNAWLLKLHRLVLNPTEASQYKELRKEPRRECLSTIEAIAETLKYLGEEKSVREPLKEIFAELLKKERARRKATK